LQKMPLALANFFLVDLGPAVALERAEVSRKPMYRARWIFDFGDHFSNATCKVSLVFGAAFMAIETVEGDIWLFELVCVIIDVKLLRLFTSKFGLTS
jgi:hypothetical protein